jgi:hypothetical protein
VDRVDPRDPRQQRALAASHQRPGIDLGLADESVLGSEDLRVREVDLRALDLRAPLAATCRHRRFLDRDRGLVQLAGDRVLLDERRIARDVLVRAGLLRLRHGMNARGPSASAASNGRGSSV